MFFTDDARQQYHPDWVIVGDNSRKVFLDWFLSGEKSGISEDTAVWIRHGVKLSVARRESHWIVETPMILPRMTICFPPADSTGFTLDTSKRTRYAVLESFPFRKDTSMDLIKRFESRGSGVMVVLMNLPRHQASTDMVPPGRDLHQAEEAYRTERRNVTVMQSPGDLQSILCWHQSIYDTWSLRFRNHLADMCEHISDIPYDYPFLEDGWQEDGGPLQEKTMDRLFSYQTTKREKGKNLWDCYAAASKRALFPPSGQGPLISVAMQYKKYLDNPLVFWSVDEDVEDFMNSLQRAFEEALEKEESKENYRMRTKLPEQLDEDSYLRLAAHSGGNGIALNAVFSRRIRDYLCDDVKGYLKERLQQRCQQLEGMIP